MPAQPGLIEPRVTRIMVWISLTAVLVMVAVYLLLITGQPSHPPDTFTVPFVVAYMVLIAVLLALSLVKLPRWIPFRAPLRAGAAAALLVLGGLAIFSIGLPILLAGGVATGAALRTLPVPPNRNSVLSSVGAGVIAVAVLIAGFEVTERVILCPAHGSQSGAGSGLVTGQYHWDCKEGKLNFQSG